MVKHNLVKDVSRKTGIVQEDVEAVLNAVLASIQGAVRRGHEVHLNGFGVFKTRVRPKKIARNLGGRGSRKNPEPIVLPATTVPHFRFSKKF